MARLFDDASSEYLENSSAVLTSAPISMAAWFNSNDGAALQALISIADGASNNNRIALAVAGDVAGNPVRLHVKTTSAHNLETSTGYTGNLWHHACGVAAAADDRRVYIDGGSKATTSDSKNPYSSMTRTGIGLIDSLTRQVYMSGLIAEAAIWNAALTDAEVAILAAGYAPPFVRPQSLVAYWPLIRDEDQDRVGGYDMTAFNTPTVAEHPPIIYPTTPYIVVPVAAGVGDLSISVSDSVSVAEATTLDVSDPQIDVADSATIAEAVTMLITDFISASDAVSVGEATSVELVNEINVNDGVTVGETTQLEIENNIDVSDGVSVAEVVTMLVTDFIDVNDAVSVSESVTVSIVAVSDLSINVSDSVTVGETTTATVSDPQVDVSDAISISESTSISIVDVGTLSLSASDGVTVGETTTATVSDPQVSVSETISVSESVSITVAEEGATTISVTESVSIAETITVAIILAAVSNRNATYVKFRDKRTIV